MAMKTTGRWAAGSAALAVSTLFLGSLPFKSAPLYADVFTPHVLWVVSSACKLGALGSGTFFASRCVRSFDLGTVVRSAWLLMRAWFACFFVGQMILTTYELTLGAAPVPSIGDAFFILGYVAVTLATVRFAAGYRQSGFAFGDPRGHVATAVVAALVFIGVGVTELGPVARSSTPVFARLVNVGYPLLDFVLLVPTVVLLRITYAFRGGRVWGVWATLLVGIGFFTAGDIAFAIPSPVTTASGPVPDLLFLLGYGFAAAGAGLQSDLLND